MMEMMMPLNRDQYTEEAIARAEEDAAQWLEGRISGYPRSWEEEERQDERHGYTMYDTPDFDAPTIMGYEALEAKGLVKRVGPVIKNGRECVRFDRIPATPEKEG